MSVSSTKQVLQQRKSSIPSSAPSSPSNRPGSFMTRNLQSPRYIVSFLLLSFMTPSLVSQVCCLLSSSFIHDAELTVSQVCCLLLLSFMTWNLQSPRYGVSFLLLLPLYPSLTIDLHVQSAADLHQSFLCLCPTRA